MNNSISFRFRDEDEHLYDLLAERASNAKVSPNIFARDLVIEALNRDDQQAVEELAEELRSTRREVERLRKGLGAALEIVLAKGLPEEEAEAVRKHLKALFGS